MLKKFKKAVGIFQWLLTAVLVLAVLLLIFTAFNPIKSFQIFRVMSGSMEPKIKVGSVVFVKKVKPEVLKKGDVITYSSSENPEMSITHRLVEIEEKEGKTVFKTRGDANNNEDMAEVSPSQIKGKVVFSLPFLGYLSVWIKKPLGFGLLVILPALLIIVSEILSIKKAIEKEVEKKYAEREKPKGNKSTVSLLIFFLLGISLFKIRPAEAYFSDVLVVSGNTFSMASDWVSPPSPTPTATPTPAEVVINEVYYDVGSGKGSEPANEWIELYNNTPQPIDVSGWKIEDNQGSSYQRTIPSSTIIPAYGYAVITPNASTWGYWSIPDTAIKIVLGSSIGNGLSNDDDRVILKKPDGVGVDSMSYGTDTYAFSPACPDVAIGHSLSRKPAGRDTNTVTDWMDTYSGSTPSGPNPGTNPHPPDLTEPTQPSPSPTPSPTPEASPTSTPTVEPSPTPEPTLTPTPTPTAEPTPVPSTTPIPSPTPEPSPTALPEPSASPTPSLSPTPSPASELPTYEIV